MSFPLLRRVGWTALLALASWSSAAKAAGLGAVQIQSGLGEPLRATVALLGGETANYEPHCIKARIASLDGALSFAPAIRVARSAASASIVLTTREALNEPALNVSVETSCDNSVRREYQILLDPIVVQTAMQSALPGETMRLAMSMRIAQTGRQGAKRDSATPQRPRKHKTKHRRTNASGQPAASSAPAPAATPEANPSEPRTTADPAARNVLKMSRADVQGENIKVITRLRAADAPSTTGNEPQQTIVQQNEEAPGAAEAYIKALREETQALRAETERIKQQHARDKAELESMRKESLIWIRSLVAVLLLCVAAVAWLMWRMLVMKKNATRVSWDELFSDTTSVTQLESNTEFSTTALQIASLDMSELGVTERPVSTSAPATDTAATTHADHARVENSRATSVVNELVDAERTPPFKYVSGGAIPYVYSNQVEAAGAPPEVALKAEEISDVMELTDAWMALHDPAAVADLLEPFVAVERPQSPLPLLCLLDVYRSLGDLEKYEAVHKRIKAIFNVKLASWKMRSDFQHPKMLADYPHVRDRILALWGTDEVVSYLDTLMLDNRDGLREGFDLPAYRDILRLKNIAGNTPTHGRASRVMDPKAYAILFASKRNDATKHPTDQALGTHGKPTSPNPAYSPATANIPTARNRTTPTPSESILLCEPELRVDIARPPPVPATSKHPLATSPVRRAETAPHFAVRDDMSPMAIKLHLAVAYTDIGDKEGACLLLEEVIQDGTHDQSEQAQQLLETLV